MRQHSGENLVVSRFDAHPNERAHAIAAEALEKDLLSDLARPAESVKRCGREVLRRNTRMTSDRARSLKHFWLPVAALLAVHAALGIGTAARLTATHDEYWHLPVGLLSWKTGRFHFDNLNPPLCRMAAALPLVFTSAQTGPIDAQHDAMGWGDAFVAANRTHYDRWFFVGRTMIVVCSVVGGLATACWRENCSATGPAASPPCSGHSSRTSSPTALLSQPTPAPQRFLSLHSMHFGSWFAVPAGG